MQHADPPRPPARRRVRATLLLRCVVLAACVALFAGVVCLGMETGWTLGGLAFAAVLWFVGIEGGMLPHAIEHFAVRRAARAGEPVVSVWFVDLDEELRRERAAFRDDTRDNPTIR